MRETVIIIIIIKNDKYIKHQNVGNVGSNFLGDVLKTSKDPCSSLELVQLLNLYKSIYKWSVIYQIKTCNKKGTGTCRNIKEL